MKTFESDGRINFVDDNNVLVGFDNSACCCEDFGHFFSKAPPERDVPCEKIEADTDGFNFDQEYFKATPPDTGSYDDGGMATFRLSNGHGDELFLTIFNHHNGYYLHGFSLEVGGETVRTGSL